MLQNTSKALSRRSAIAMVGVSAIAVSASSSTAIASANPDAELLALGKQLESVLVEWIATRVIDKRRVGAHEAACLAADLPRLDIESVPIEEYRERNLVRGMVHYIGKDEEVDLDWDGIHARSFPLCHRIMACRPHTPAGLGVMARAMSVLFTEFSEAEEPSSLAEATGPFVEAVCKFAGVKSAMSEAAERIGSSAPTPTLTTLEPDPIFEAIDLRRKAWAAFADATLIEGRLEGNARHGKPAKPGYEEAKAERERTNDEAEEAAALLEETEPTTIAGTIALLRFLAKPEPNDNDQLRDLLTSGGYNSDSEDFAEGEPFAFTCNVHATLADALEKMAVAS